MCLRESLDNFLYFPLRNSYGRKESKPVLVTCSPCRALVLHRILSAFPIENKFSCVRFENWQNNAFQSLTSNVINFFLKFYFTTCYKVEEAVFRVVVSFPSLTPFVFTAKLPEVS